LVARPGSSSPNRQSVFDTSVGSVLPVLAGVLALVFAVTACVHPFMLTGSPRVLLTSVAATTSLAFGILFAWTTRRPLPAHLAHPVTAAALLLVLANPLTRMYVTKSLLDTSTVMLMVAVTGGLILSLRWYVSALVVAWSLWALVFSLTPGTQRAHWIIGMILATAVSVGLHIARRVQTQQLAQAAEAAQRAAVEDGLTGLLNRRGLVLVGDQMVANARRSGNAVHCVFLDVDGLKSVNDRFGHAAGDLVLVAVADSLRQAVRSGDVVARWGGDEFCVIGPGPGTTPLELESRVAQNLAALPAEDRAGWEPGVSAGAAMLAPWDDGDLAILLENADREMYRRRTLRRRDDVPRERQPASE
jgi:diguanylate cyclase (GGDEF)-like protein